MASEDGFVVRVRGIPLSLGKRDVAAFFEGANILNGQNGIRFIQSPTGQPTGDAFIELASETDLTKALAKHKQQLNGRYIEVMRSQRSDIEQTMEQTNASQPGVHGNEPVVRLRGLPYDCSKGEIDRFFQGLEIAPHGITIVVNQEGRSNGNAYVEFVDQHAVGCALAKSGVGKIGGRCIEVLRSSKADIQHVVG